VEKLLPLATVVTPNIPEARVLTRSGEDVSQADLARAVVALGPKAAVVTGGHSEKVVDYFFAGEEVTPIRAPAMAEGASHGSGCTHSPRWPRLLALGHDLLPAAEKARGSPPKRSRKACAISARGPGPVTSRGWRSRLSRFRCS